MNPRVAVWLTVCLLCCLLRNVCGFNITLTQYESEDLGHIRYENGTLEWGTFPTPISSSERQIVKRSSAWDSTVDFAVAIVDSVQTRSFPYDLLRRILQNSYSEDEVLDYQTNVIVVTAIGGLLAAAILVTMAVYKLVRWRRGPSDTFLLYIPELAPFRVKVIVGVGAFLMTIDLMFVLFSLAASGHALTGALKLDDVVNDAMNDVTNYFAGFRQHYDFITANTSNWLIQDVMISDLNDVGLLLWETGRDEFLPQINAALQTVADFDTKAAQALNLLSNVESDVVSTLSGVGGDLDAVLTAVHYNLTQTVNDYTCIGCDGSCSGCSAIVPDDIFLNADFGVLPNITSNLADLQTLLSTPIAGSMQSPEYYFTYGIADFITRNSNVTTARDGLIQDLLSYGNTWGNATSQALYPNESTFWFDTLKPRWNSFYEEMEAKEIARFTFILLFSLLTMATMGVTIAAVVIAGKRGIFKEPTGKEDFDFPKRLLGWCIVAEMTLASCHLAMAAAGFYTGANLEKAVCEPGESWGIVRQVIDTPSAIPGHPDYFLSFVLLGNGTLGPIKMADVLSACSSDSAGYSVFYHSLLMPDMQQDLQNYSQHLTGHESLVDMMRVNLDGVTLVPPGFVTWLAAFDLATDFNYTEYTTLLNGNVINADVDTYAANLQTIHNTGSPDGPLEPAKTRLATAANWLLAEKANIAAVDQIKNDLATVFADFVAMVTDIQTTANQTMEDLLALEPALHAMAANAISRGVDQTFAEFFYLLDMASNQTWEWVGEAGACRQLRDAYDSAVSSFCDNYADYQNASWLLLGHTCLFLLMWTSLSFIVYKSMPGHMDSHTGDDDLDVVGVSHSKPRAWIIERRTSGTLSPVPEIAVTPAGAADDSLTDSSDGYPPEQGRTSARTVRGVSVDMGQAARFGRKDSKASYVTEDIPRRASYDSIVPDYPGSGGVSPPEEDYPYPAGRARSDSKASYITEDVPRRSSHSKVAPYVPPHGGASSPEVTPDMWSAAPRSSSAASFVASGGGNRSKTRTPRAMRVESLDD